VAGAELRDRALGGDGFHLLFFEFLDDVHWSLPLCLITAEEHRSAQNILAGTARASQRMGNKKGA
ncbi:MAG: hypothetical protein KDJ36_18690, partial [Hyphomicrobiaceae bacterium]|nr:hypothetical protein [Hyphomicrobiaceae bacterium]